MPQCTAKSSQSGQRCRKDAIQGSNVCRVHGGSAPQVRAKAKQRLLEAADPAAAYLASLVADRKAPPSDRRQAAVAILDRAGHPAKSGLEVTGEDGGPVSIEVRYVETGKAGEGD